MTVKGTPFAVSKKKKGYDAAFAQRFCLNVAFLMDRRCARCLRFFDGALWLAEGHQVCRLF